MVDDAGQPISYLVLAPGTAVHASGGEHVGEVSKVLADEREDVFDGLVIVTPDGSRFIDGPDVAHIAERRVDLALTAAEVAASPEHEEGGARFEANVPSSRMADVWRRITGGGLWRRD
jgi:hypothetical protein